jgi:hypothetical protein
MSVNDPLARPTPEPKGNFQDRVNQLTRRASDAERVAAASAAENAQLVSQLGKLEQQIADLAARQAPTASPKPPGDLSAADQPANLDAMAQKITEQVLGAIEPTLAEVKQSKADEQLAAQQQASFNAARQIHPELGDPKSKFYETFEALWNNRPDVQKVVGAPQLLAEATRGLLSDARAKEQIVKMAAAADTPSGSRVVDNPSDAQEVDKALGDLTKVGKTEGWSNDEFDDYLKLQFHKHGQQNRK